MAESAKPLMGMRILVTRPRGKTASLAALLRQEGAEPVEFPTIEITPPSDWAPLDSALRRLDSFDWVIFTSAQGVDVFFERRRILGIEPGLSTNLRWGAIGPATARALVKRALKADFTPSRYVAEAIVEEIGDVRGKRILLPRAEGARPVLPFGLRVAGAEVEEVVAYRTVPSGDIGSLAQVLKNGGIAIMTFTSPSGVRSLIGGMESELLSHLARIPVACLGPITAQAARELGLRVEIVAQEHTVQGLVRALVASFETKS